MTRSNLIHHLRFRWIAPGKRHVILVIDLAQPVYGRGAGHNGWIQCSRGSRSFRLKTLFSQPLRVGPAGLGGLEQRLFVGGEKAFRIVHVAHGRMGVDNPLEDADPGLLGIDPSLAQLMVFCNQIPGLRQIPPHENVFANLSDSFDYLKAGSASG